MFTLSMGLEKSLTSLKRKPRGSSVRIPSGNPVWMGVGAGVMATVAPLGGAVEQIKGPELPIRVGMVPVHVYDAGHSTHELG
jgi:hypothetical protein